jgi:hypothetical protein
LYSAKLIKTFKKLTVAKDAMAIVGDIKKSVIQAVRTPKRYMFNRVVRAIRKYRLKRASFLRTSNKLIPVVGAFFVLFKVINISNPSEENIVLYKSLMIVIAVATLVTDWYFDYLNLCLRFKKS